MACKPWRKFVEEPKRRECYGWGLVAVNENQIIKLILVLPFNPRSIYTPGLNWVGGKNSIQKMAIHCYRQNAI